MPLFQERRASPRRLVNCPGSIVCDTAAAPLDCVVADLSEGGARLIVPSGVPEEFALVVKDGSETSQRCRVAWRLDEEIGVEFI